MVVFATTDARYTRIHTPMGVGEPDRIWVGEADFSRTTQESLERPPDFVLETRLQDIANPRTGRYFSVEQAAFRLRLTGGGNLVSRSDSTPVVVQLRGQGFYSGQGTGEEAFIPLVASTAFFIDTPISQSTNRILTIARLDKPHFLGAPLGNQGLAARVAIGAFLSYGGGGTPIPVTQSVEISMRVWGYMWGPGALNAPGGLRRPLDSPFAR